ncbi:alpha-tocopherol transfer protein-like [Diabrotica undecimpunctata]|uniref:alpha-tocopherol transfer protein-like n=1 Tax=Diabrotica undecimpunctata TaxID=50387 RepID=UPI003B633A0B
MLTTSNLLLTDRKKIREQWKKSEFQLGIEIDIIRKWCKTQKHLPEIPCDNTIEYFLTNCKFSIEKTKQNLDMYYTIPNLLPEMYENKHPCRDNMTAVKEVAYMIPLPRLTEDLHRITVVKFKDSDPDLFVPVNYSSFLFRNIFEIKNREDLTLGEIFVIDFKYFKFGHVIKISPLFAKNCAFILEKVWSNRLRELHFINAPVYIDRIMALVKAFFSKKLQERVYIHSDMEELFKMVPRELLPSDYGGQEPSLDEFQRVWSQKFEENKERFNTLDTLKVNESLRPEKLENSEILGYHGNFKKIEVD